MYRKNLKNWSAIAVLLLLNFEYLMKHYKDNNQKMPFPRKRESSRFQGVLDPRLHGGDRALVVSLLFQTSIVRRQ